MSIRHYNPRRRRRGGISPKARNFLGALVALIILLQISYPLIEGEALRIVTIATVFVAAIAMVVQELGVSEEKAKQLRFLISRGFSTSVLYEVLGTYVDDFLPFDDE